MKETIIVFLWITAIVALFTVATVIYDIVVSHKEKKANQEKIDKDQKQDDHR